MTREMLDTVTVSRARPGYPPPRVAEIQDRLRSGGGRLALLVAAAFAIAGSIVISIGATQ